VNELFGLSMTYVAVGCAVVTLLIFGFVGWIALRNPVMFKNGLRNIPRRPPQTALIVIGLMLSTLIVTAAFGTGDTMTHSVSNEVFTILGPVDEIIHWDTKLNPAPEDKQTIPLDQVDAWKKQFTADGGVDALIAYLREYMPVLDLRTRLNEANPRITAARPADVASFGGLRDTDGNQVTLGPREIALDEELAGNVDARVGDPVRLLYKGTPVDLTVKAIVPNSLAGGANNTLAREGAAVNFDFLAKLVGREGKADFVAVSNDGTERGGLDSADRVTKRLETALVGTPYKVDNAKKDGVHQAELLGNVFTSVFVIFGLFSISAGILLIFLIFIMLAAERKPEMGMARAVGAKRRQIVESFLAEGMGYDLGSAVVGLFAGIAVAAAMVYFVKLRVGETLGLDLQFSVAGRSLVVAFCLGVIVTFIVVFLASWRASRLNIVAAIRDLPESKRADPEAATWRGYFRGALNGFAAFGILVFSLLAALHFRQFAAIFLLGALAGVAGPWLGMLRGHNFGAPASDRKTGERIPVWPFILGVVTLPLGVGLLILLGYPLALLVIRLTRDRKPRSMPLSLVVLGILVAPLGVVLAALQDRSRQVAWSAGVGAVGLATGVLLMQWGISGERMALFAGGCSLVALWAAVTLRYFHFHERLVFTATSFALLALWYALPGGRLSGLVGKLDAGPEMFFLSGAVMVTCGTFIVVYNADVILPAIATLGSRFGRITPAVKTAVAYPLTARFRTGLTIAMIGLIMFVLSMQAALNTNFSKAFAGDDARGGWDDRVLVNGNNRADELIAALQNPQPVQDQQPIDTSSISSVGELRVAEAFEVDVEDPEWLNADPATRKEKDHFKHVTLYGADAGFIQGQAIPLKFRAAGYVTDQAVWDAVAKDANLAIIPALLTSGRRGFGPPGVEDVLELPERYTSKGFQPFKLRFRDRTSGIAVEITVIGQAKDSAGTFWPGIFVQKDVVLRTFPDSKGQQFFVGLRPGVDSRQYAKSIEATLVQASADSLNKIIDDNQAQNRTFLEMFQGFLALGLIVGVAALGVISFRAVVERRQQIGMLRAIGYQRRMVQLSFLLESGFIAVSGILLGLALGLTFAWNLFDSGEFGETSSGISFTVPWAQVTLVTAFALLASMVMTYLPARAASRVAVAEALRYE